MGSTPCRVNERYIQYLSAGIEAPTFTHGACTTARAGAQHTSQARVVPVPLSHLQRQVLVLWLGHGVAVAADGGRGGAQDGADAARRRRHVATGHALGRGGCLRSKRKHRQDQRLPPQRRRQALQTHQARCKGQRHMAMAEALLKTVWPTHPRTAVVDRHSGPGMAMAGRLLPTPPRRLQLRRLGLPHAHCWGARLCRLGA